jgi:hypothetical protein
VVYGAAGFLVIGKIEEPQMASQWYVRSKGKVYGPLDSKSLKQLAVDGKIDGSTEVAQSQSGPWSAANKVRGLFDPPPSPSISQPTATSVDGG